MSTEKPVAALLMALCMVGIVVKPVSAQTTPDGFNWVKYWGNPVLKREAGTPHPWNISQFTVLFEDGIFKMWATAGELGVGGKVEYFTSADGVNWISKGVVFNLGGGAYQGVVCGSVIHDGSLYKMWFYANDVGDFPPGSVGNAIGYATSPDGLNWTNHGKVLDVGRTSHGQIKVIKDGTVFRMWFSAYDMTAPRDSWIGHASSQNGMNWTYLGRAVTPGRPGDFDQFFIGPTEVLKPDGIFKMWYSAVEIYGEPLNIRIFYATSLDGLTWMKHGVVLEGSSAPHENWGVGNLGTIIPGNPTRL